MEPAGRALKASATITSLPDDLLVRVFGFLDPLDIVGSAALVCRRWSRLSCSPSLFPHVSVDASWPGDNLGGLQRLRGFAAWLCGHALGPHVRGLFLAAPMPADGSSEEAQLVTTVIGELGGPGCALEHLHLSMSTERQVVAVSVWVQRLTALQELYLAATIMDVTVSLKPLACLRQLQLYAGARLTLQPDVALPPSLKIVSLQDGSGQDIPQQVFTLPALRDLGLYDVCSAITAVPGLLPSSLAGGLTQLLLGSCGRLPAGLTALTGLECLHLSNSGFVEEWEALGPALAACAASLTSLWLEGRQMVVPLQLAACTRLQRLLVCGHSLEDDNADHPEYQLDANGNGDPRLVLPLGGWLAGLTHLAASAPVLLHNTLALADMGSLEQLSLVRLVSLDDSLLDTWWDQWEALVEWCSGDDSPLRRLCLWSPGPVHPRLFDAALGLSRSQPLLCIERHNSPFEPNDL